MGDDPYADADNAREITKAMTARARELGWDVEWNWRDMDDGTWSYDAWLSRATATETQTGGTEHAQRPDTEGGVWGSYIADLHALVEAKRNSLLTDLAEAIADSRRYSAEQMNRSSVNVARSAAPDSSTPPPSPEGERARRREYSVRYQDGYVIAPNFTEQGALKRAEETDGVAVWRPVGEWLVLPAALDGGQPDTGETP